MFRIFVRMWILAAQESSCLAVKILVEQEWRGDDGEVLAGGQWLATW